VNDNELYRVVSAFDEHGFAREVLEQDLEEIYRDGSPPVGIERFLDDDYFMARVAKDLYPENRPEVLDIFDPKNSYIEVILTGATSIGKTFMASLAMSYMIYVIGKFVEPHRWVGGSSASPIVMINMSISAQKAHEVVFTRVKNMVDKSPYFRERFPRDFRLNESLVWRTGTGSALQFKSGTGDSLSALGDDIYAGIGDELNFFRVIEASKRSYGEAYDPAQRLYDVISRRMMGRFSAGGLPLGKFFLLSSAQYPDDFIERRIREAEESGALGRTIKLVRRSVWEAQRGVSIAGRPVYGEKRFRVEVGSDRRGSRLLDTYDRRADEVFPLVADDVEGKVITPPVELYDYFRRDVEGSVRDFGGEVTRAISPFFSDTSPIYAAAEAGRELELEHPWSREATTLEDGSSLRKEALFEYDEKEKRWFPIQHPRTPRYAHVDLASTGDSAGVAVVHVAEWRKTVRGGREMVEPVFQTDLLLRVDPPVGGEIRFARVRELFYLLRSYGMNLQTITYDSFQSTDSIQELSAKGFRADTLSVDRDASPYTYLRDAFMDGRVIMYLYEPLVVELTRLERRAQKVDHPANGSKDVSDALCGAVWGAFISEARMSLSDVEARLPLTRHNAPPWRSEKEQTKIRDLVDAEEELREFVGGSKIVRP